MTQYTELHNFKVISYHNIYGSKNHIKQLITFLLFHKNIYSLLNFRM